MGESGNINEICEALDPKFEMIQGRYGRENTLLKDGKYIKDFPYMNRPLKDVVYLDFTDENVEFHKDNCILLSDFKGDTGDRDLIDLIPFLERKYPLIFHFYRFGKIPRRCQEGDSQVRQRHMRKEVPGIIDAEVTIYNAAEELGPQWVDEWQVRQMNHFIS